MAARQDLKGPVKDSIQRLLFKVTELEAIISDFQGDNDLLHQKLNEYVEELRTLQSLRDNLAPGGQPIEVPLELLRYVDDGGNPDVFTVDAIRASVATNQASKGKVEAFRLLQSKVTSKLQEAFPQHVADYQRLREEAQPEGGGPGLGEPAGQQQQAQQQQAAAPQPGGQAAPP